MKTEVEERFLLRILYYPEANRVVAHLYDRSGHFKYRASVEAFDGGTYRAIVASLLAALRAAVESDPTF